MVSSNSDSYSGRVRKWQCKLASCFSNWGREIT